MESSVTVSVTPNGRDGLAHVPGEAGYQDARPDRLLSEGTGVDAVSAAEGPCVTGIVVLVESLPVEVACGATVVVEIGAIVVVFVALVSGRECVARRSERPRSGLDDLTSTTSD
ncbi:MAG TPA: hypothetical protein VEJ87_07575 [Acidimicrobiales bacterium]|nr:hypothetical protein [Acidimicrobiales bacterium]